MFTPESMNSVEGGQKKIGVVIYFSQTVNAPWRVGRVRKLDENKEQGEETGSPATTSAQSPRVPQDAGVLCARLTALHRFFVRHSVAVVHYPCICMA